MKKNLKSNLQKGIILCFILFFQGIVAYASPFQQNQQDGYIEYRGKVVDNRSEKPLPSVFVSVDKTNISTVTNAEGEFSLKLPENITNTTVRFSSLRYLSKTLPLDFFKEENKVIGLEESIEELSEVAIFDAQDAKKLVHKVLEKRGENYFNEATRMTAFYRESIKKRNKNVSLSEAVVTIHKEPYDTRTKEKIEIVKSRKSADYEKLDTLALKYRGGPYNNLYVDLIKYSDNLFNREDLEDFKFSFDDPIKINDRFLYVVDFEEREQATPWYFGKLFIDAEKLTLVKAIFNLNVDNRRVAAQMLVKKKPGGTKVYPLEVKYEINYRERDDGKWYYGYGRTESLFVVNWKRKLFNSRYTVNSEMAVTDWKINTEGKVKRDENFISDKVIMADEASGFADAGFWGANNIIEPDKSIENAIEKIQEKLKNEEK